MKGSDQKGVPYSPAYLIEDAPWTYTPSSLLGTKKNWSPKNYEKGYRGKIPLREAFANSVNIPMAKIAVDVGLDRVVEVAGKLGIKEHLPAIPSLSLGSIDLNPIELLQAYSTIANRGEKVELMSVRGVVDENGKVLAKFSSQSVRVFEPNVIDLLRDLLHSVVVEGTAKSLVDYGYAKPAYGKTGTTSFSRDAWFAGFSQGLAAVAWVGFEELKVPDSEDEEGTKAFKAPAALTGAGAALPVWARFFVAAEPSKISDPEPELDSSLEKRKIDRKSGGLAKPTCPADTVMEEVFLPGSAPTEECRVH